MVFHASLGVRSSPKARRPGLGSCWRCYSGKGNQFKNTTHKSRVLTSRNRGTESSPAYMLGIIMHPCPIFNPRRRPVAFCAAQCGIHSAKSDFMEHW